MNHKQAVGRFGEDLAKDYLIRHGYKIIAANIKTSYKEIDIVAEKNKVLVFVEVKTRTSKIFGGADETITHSKIENLKQAVSAYLMSVKNKKGDFRLDLISIDIEKDKKIAKIKHYKDII